MEEKLKHLEFIQNTITRMCSNSFMIKGWCIAIVVALLAFTAKESNGDYATIACFVIFVFWILDGFFISSERRFRALYDDIRILAHWKITNLPQIMTGKRSKKEGILLSKNGSMTI